jgi:hypothetical protein
MGWEPSGCGLRIQHLDLAVVDRGAQPLDANDEACDWAGRELRLGPVCLAGGHRVPLSHPSRQPAVEDEDTIVAEGAKQPPGPTRPSRRTFLAVDDDCVFVRHTHGSDLRGKVLRGGTGIRELARRIGHGAMIEKQRARNV